MTEERARHALEPLTADDITAGVSILRQQRQLPGRHRFVEISLREPLKDLLLASGGYGIDRELFLVLLDCSTGATYEAVVSLTSGTVDSWQRVPGVQPAITLEEFAECEAACKADPGWR